MSTCRQDHRGYILYSSNQYAHVWVPVMVGRCQNYLDYLDELIAGFATNSKPFKGHHTSSTELGLVQEATYLLTGVTSEIQERNDFNLRPELCVPSLQKYAIQLAPITHIARFDLGSPTRRLKKFHPTHLCQFSHKSIQIVLRSLQSWKKYNTY